MSENKTKPTEISVADFLASADSKKLNDSNRLIEIKERLSGEKAKMWGPSIIGFGTYHYKYKTGREGDMCKIGFSPRKDKFSLYILDCDDDDNNDLLSQLGKCSKTVACIYFKKLDDLNIDILEKMIVQSLKHTEQKWG